MRYKSITAILCSIVLMTGCGTNSSNSTATASNPQKIPETPADTTEAVSAASIQDAASSASTSNDSDFDRDLLGDWEFMCCSSSSSDSDSTYFYMSDDEPIGGNISIYEEDGVCYADFDHYSYESSRETYHIPLKVMKGALYPDCPNQDWYAEFTNPHTKTSFSLALTGKNELVYYQEDTYDDYDGGSWTNYEVETYVRKGSEEAGNPDKYRYSNSVTVSTAAELLDNISSNTVIRLKPGVYNFSEVSRGTLNRNVYTEVDKFSDDLKTTSVQIRNVSNLRIEAEDGAEVEICIDEPYSPVIGLYNCNRVTFKGFKCGHTAEPGTCGGSVIYAHQSGSVTISECRLYGSGSYGVETYGGYGLYVNNSEIYDCTYGIAYCTDTSDIEFTNCNMHDNTGYTMLDFNQCYNARFNGCTFTQNISGTGADGAYPFVRNYEGSEFITFENCTFDKNQYAGFSETDNVQTIHCKINDKELGFG